jgi:hypothetical protein
MTDGVTGEVPRSVNSFARAWGKWPRPSAPAPMRARATTMKNRRLENKKLIALKSCLGSKKG